MIYIILTAIAAAAAVIATLIVINSKRTREEAAVRAGSMIIKKHKLDQALRTSLPDADHRYWPMLLLTWKKGGKGYVFDGLQGVRIGRTPKNNDIAIVDVDVSVIHCRLFCYGNEIYAEDMGSTNGTYIAGLFRNRAVSGAMAIPDNSTVIVGDTRIKVHLFFVDTAYI